MKKVFVEPDLQRIELNLNENIASLSQSIAGYYFNTQMFGGCYVQNTGYTIFDLQAHMNESIVVACAFYNARRMSQFYSIEEIRANMK